MDPDQHREHNGSNGKGYYAWQPPGHSFTVRIAFDVMDRIEADIMWGFGAAPRRGVEVGGVLIGTVDEDRGPLVTIEDFDAVGSEHPLGPSYVLQGNELEQLVEVVERWSPESGRAWQAVGYFRSQTRNGLGLTAEDLRVIDSCFPQPTVVALLVKPYGTGPSLGGFFFRENGSFRSGNSLLEFPFSSRELGVPALPNARGSETQRSPEADPPSVASRRDNAVNRPASVDNGYEMENGQTPSRTSSSLRSGWLWIPLSFIFLLLGIVLGFQIALSMKPASSPPSQLSPYQLDLTAEHSGQDVHLRWNREAPVIEAASRGQLLIIDGDSQRTVNLDVSQLRTGSVIYRRAGNKIRFRLEVSPRERVAVAETLDFDSSIPEGRPASR